MNDEQDHSVGWRAEGVGLFEGRLLARPRVLFDESYLGYRLRVAIANGLSNPSWLGCTDANLPKAHGIARWCPRCLAEDDCYWHECWYTGPAACFRHRCWLVSRCGGCRRMLRWNRTRFACCVCGAQLRDAPAVSFSAELQNLLDEQHDTSTARLALEEKWHVARFLGALYKFGLQGKPLKKASRQWEGVEQALVTTGALLVGDWPTCFELFDRLRVPQTGESNVPLLSEVFPRLLTMLRKQLNEVERQWMLGVLNVYVAHSSCHGAPLIWERKRTSNRGIDALCGQQRVRNPVIATMLERIGADVPVRRTRAGRRKFVINPVDLQDLQETRRSLVPLKTAARYAGMSAGRIQALAKANLIASVGGRINLRSVDRLLGNLATSCGGDIAVFGDPICVAEALRLYVPVSGSAAFFTGLLSSGIRLALGPSTVPTLRNIFTDRCRVSFIVRGAVGSSSSISIVEAARQLGVKQEVMYHLINKGLLRTHAGKLGRRTARVVDARDLRNFTERFQPLLAIAKEAGISARAAPSWARQRGIEIVTGPSVDGSRQYWIRKQAPEFLAARNRWHD